jgi:hypothetical protein
MCSVHVPYHVPQEIFKATVQYSTVMPNLKKKKHCANIIEYTTTYPRSYKRRERGIRNSVMRFCHEDGSSVPKKEIWPNEPNEIGHSVISPAL